MLGLFIFMWHFFGGFTLLFMEDDGSFSRTGLQRILIIMSGPISILIFLIGYYLNKRENDKLNEEILRSQRLLREMNDSLNIKKKVKKEQFKLLKGYDKV